MNATPSPPIPDVTERIAQLIYLLCQTVSERCLGPRARTLTVAQVNYICGRLLAARKRFRRVVALIRAGKPPKIRARRPPKPRPVKPKRKTLAEIAAEAERDSRIRLPRGWRRWAREDRVRARAAEAAEKAARALAAAGKPVPLWRALRQDRFGWLCGLVPQIFHHRHSAASCRTEMLRLLAEPDVQALLMSHPYVGESLREVCWALRIEGSLLHLRPKVAAAPVAVEPAPAMAAPAEIVPPPPPAAWTSSAKTAAPHENHSVPVAIVPSPPTVAGEFASSRASPDAPEKSEFFTPG